MSKKVETKNAVIAAKMETARMAHLIDGHWRPAVERLEAENAELRVALAEARGATGGMAFSSWLKDQQADLAEAQRWAAWFAAERNAYSAALNWGTSCLNCSRSMDLSYDEFIRADRAKAALAEANTTIARLQNRETEAADLVFDTYMSDAECRSYLRATYTEGGP